MCWLSQGLNHHCFDKCWVFTVICQIRFFSWRQRKGRNWFQSSKVRSLNPRMWTCVLEVTTKRRLLFFFFNEQEREILTDTLDYVWRTMNKSVNASNWALAWIGSLWRALECNEMWENRKVQTICKTGLTSEIVKRYWEDTTKARIGTAMVSLRKFCILKIFVKLKLAILT